MTIAAAGLFFGFTVGLCAAPVWAMLMLPMRMTDVWDAGSMRLCALALTLGAAFAAMEPFSCHLGWVCGAAGMLGGGIFVGMLASALTEALDVVPVLHHRLRLPGSMKHAAVALMLGKGAGALLAAYWMM